MKSKEIKKEFMKIILKELKHDVEQSNYCKMYAKISMLELVLQEDN